MEVSKGPGDILVTLEQGLEELSHLNTEYTVLHQALKMSLATLRISTGYMIRKTNSDTWEIEGIKEGAYVPPNIIEKLSPEDILPADGIMHQRVIPVRVNGKVIAALWLGEPPVLFQGTKESDPSPSPCPLPQGERVKDAASMSLWLANGYENPSPHGGEGKGEGVGADETDPAQHAFLSLISRYLSIIISSMRLREDMREMKTHYEEIIIKKETAEKLASLGTIAAGLAHEIKNPLVSIKTLAQLLPQRFDDPEFRDRFTSIAISEVDRISSIVSDLLDFAKSHQPRFELLEIENFIDDIILMFSPQFSKGGINVIKRFIERPPLIHVDPSQLKQVLLNIFINSLEAMPYGGEIIVEISGREKGLDSEKVVIKITDTGIGIDQENMEHLFEPFFTTKGSGTGLGLSVCRSIIEKHLGDMYIDSVYNKGTTVTLVLPVNLIP